MQEDAWSHVQETVNMLYLAVCQIEATLSDSDESVDTLTHAFTNIADNTQRIYGHSKSLNEPQQLDLFREELASTATGLQNSIKDSVQAFQFYDRVCQRLDHVARSLEKVSRVVSDDQNRCSQVAWEEIQDQIKSSYTMEAEKLMFEYLMRGGSVEEALQVYRHHFASHDGKIDQDGDEIELF